MKINVLPLNRAVFYAYDSLSLMGKNEQILGWVQHICVRCMRCGWFGSSDGYGVGGPPDELDVLRLVSTEWNFHYTEGGRV